MLTVVIILVLAGVVLFFIMNTISTKHLAEANALESQKHALLNKFDFMVNQRKALRKEIEKKEQELASMRHGQEGIRTFSSRDLQIDNESDDQKMSRYLIQEGRISLEQNENVIKKMEVLKMDYIAACLTLGYIDLATAKKAMKINKISSKKLSLNA